MGQFYPGCRDGDDRWHARTQQQQPMCIEVGVLGRAVAIEHDLKWWPGQMDHVTERMRSQQDRRFVFAKVEALSIVGKEHGYIDFDVPLCGLIRDNLYALRGDWAPILYVGQVRKQ